jgi:hypothetical protein
MFEVNAQRDEGFSASFHCTKQFIDFLPVEQELAFPARGMILKIPKSIFPDVRVVEPNLTFFNPAKRVPNLGISLANGFHLGALQH